MNPLLRSSLLLAALGTALSASAQVTYVFNTRQEFPASGEVDAASFTLVVPDFVTATSAKTTFDLGDGFLLSATHTTTQGGATTTTALGPVSFLFDVAPGFDGISADGTHGFASGTFSTPGTFDGADGISSLTVQTVPEPASLAALGLGGLAFLRRRKRA